MKFTTVDCCPCPTGTSGDNMDKIIAKRLAASGATAASLYRGEDPNAAKYLTGAAPCYKHDQAWIYANYPPGVANPPYHSTHELFNDGAAYPVADGAKLEPWQLGQDIDDAHVDEYMAVARKEGAVVTRTYPTSPVEYHHVNDRFKPRFVPPFDPLGHGDRGIRVLKLTRRLHYIRHRNGAPFLSRPYGTYKLEVVEAVKEFQREHSLSADGVVGIHTFEQIERTFRHQWQRRHKGKSVPRRHRVALEAK